MTASTDRWALLATLRVLKAVEQTDHEHRRAEPNDRQQRELRRARALAALDHARQVVEQDRWYGDVDTEQAPPANPAPREWLLNRICQECECLPSEAAAIESLLALDPDALALVRRALDAIAKARTA